MAYDITQVKGTPISTSVKEFAIDSRAEVANLPTQTTKGTSTDGQPYEEDYIATGSTAVCKDGSVFYLFPSGWAEL